MTDDEVSNNQLISRVLQSTDIAGNILNALSVVDDKAGADKYDQIIKDMQTETLTNAQALTAIALQDGYTILRQSILRLPATLISMQAFNKDIAYAGKRGLNMTANMMTIRNKFYAQAHNADLDNYLIYNIPASIIKNKVTEWYMDAIRPANPSEALIVQQYIRGNCTATQASHYLAIKGVPNDLAMWLYDSYENYPSMREMTIASEYTNITDADLLANMKYSNITLQKNKDFYLNYAHAIQLRTELNQYLQQLRQDYNSGLLTQAELTAELVAHKPNANEQAQIIANCNKSRNRVLINMEVQSRIWLYRKGIFGEVATDGDAETALYYALIELDLDPLFANALTRFESCKLGYNWERD